ncbi:MAG: AAA family ATPase [Chloroflexi bacterium RBG_16_72_14]|nr:MAG: AAA family ATPase [Chloroflexi bacterium RBG_16_72_14]
MDYRPRIVDPELDGLLAGVPALAIHGARGVGKTETAQRRAVTQFRLDDPRVRAIAEADPARLTRGPHPTLIDEWQRLPESWDIVRRAVDDDRTPGRFLLTGSTSPAHPPTHSGAGRIVSLRMRPMSLAERGIATPTVSLADLLSGHRGPIAGTSDVTLDQYAHEIVRSGFPGLRDLEERGLRAELDGYLDHIVDRDFEASGHPVRNVAALRRWMQAYAAVVSATTSFEKIRDAATAGHADKPAKTTVMRYADVLEGMWILDPVPAWHPGNSALTRLTLAPKHHLADPALAARLLRATVQTLLAGIAPGPGGHPHATLYGALFESLVTLNVRVFAQALDAGVYHFRDRGGAHEIDLIVEGPGLSVVAIETKLAATIGDHDVRHLAWLQQQLGGRLVDAAIVTTGRDAYRRRDGIAVIPAALLGP